VCGNGPLNALGHDEADFVCSAFLRTRSSAFELGWIARGRFYPFGGSGLVDVSFQVSTGSSGNASCINMQLKNSWQLEVLQSDERFE
jgi:hypothetical protein